MEREEESRGLNLLYQVVCLKDKISNTYPNMFYSNDEILLKQINASTDNEWVLSQLEPKTMEELVNLLILNDISKPLTNCSLTCIHMIVNRIIEVPLPMEMKEEILIYVRSFIIVC